MKRSIETKIRLNAIIIYILVAFTCGGIFLYFYSSWKNIDDKKKTMEEYNSELTQINQLIQTVNQAQAEVNLYIITERKKHLREFQAQAKQINLQIDSLKQKQIGLEMDTILSEITQLLKKKEYSIISLNKQFSLRNPIDSLSQSLSTFSSTIHNEQADTVVATVIKDPEPAPKRGFWRKVTGIFSSSNKEDKKENLTDTISVHTVINNNTISTSDTTQLNLILQRARVDYDQHISAIENQINSVVLTDQYITLRITELLTQLYNQIIHSRMDEIAQDEAMLKKNNIRALWFGGIALVLILTLIILILNNVNKGYTARKALEQANERTRQLMESRHKLLLSVSHDVKTPLNSILGYTELYKQQGILSDEETRPIHSSGEHILALLQNLLEFSSLQKGSVTLAPRNFTPQELCVELCEMFMPLATKKSLSFVYQEDLPQELTVHADCLKIKQILANILSNAIKYTIEGSIIFQASYTDNTLIFKITDTGAGIPEDKRDSLFKPFSRIEENSALDEGSGFGLYVVKGLVELFKGEISFESEQGKGTCITVRLPVTEGKMQQAADPSTKNILLIDDDNVFLDMLSHLCCQLGHRVTTCKNRYAFKNELKDISTYDYILTDMEMENFTGKDVLKKVREADKNIPLILITGRTDFTPTMVLSQGFTDYLIKPVNIRELHALIGGRMEEEKKNEKENLSQTHPSANDNLNTITEFLGGDTEAVQEVMDKFVMATVEHIVQLRKAAEEKDFDKAQYLCHKMLPMFLQINAPEDITATLKHMDNLRGENKSDDKIWNDLSTLADRIEEFLMLYTP